MNNHQAKKYVVPIIHSEFVIAHNLNVHSGPNWSSSKGQQLQQHQFEQEAKQITMNWTTMRTSLHDVIYDCFLPPGATSQELTMAGGTQKYVAYATPTLALLLNFS